MDNLNERESEVFLVRRRQQLRLLETEAENRKWMQMVDEGVPYEQRLEFLRRMRRLSRALGLFYLV